MLIELKVTNFAIIDSVQINFQAGLNILSGETGAGKSILLKSLALLMGEKADPSTVRTGADSAVIEGYFDLTARSDLAERLKDLGLPNEDDSLIVRRWIPRQGKGRVYINGMLSPVSALRELITPLVEVMGAAVPLIEMTGQNDNRHLMSRSYHLDLLDQFAGALALRQHFAETHQCDLELKRRIAEIESETRLRASRLDFLRFQRDEISAFAPKPGEESQLEAEVKRLKNSARISQALEHIEAMLYSEDDAVTTRLQTAIQRASELAKYDGNLRTMCEPLNQAGSLIEDVVFELRKYLKNLELNPDQLDGLEKRLSDFRGLQKKYGSSSEEILGSLARIEAELAGLDGAATDLVQYRSESTRLEGELQELGKQLTQRRAEAATLLAREVNEELADLNMKGLIFHVRSQPTTQKSATGFDEVEFLTQTSPSDPPRPLSKFASGGELSRILLAIKQVVGGSQFPRTYLFDEVDAGVSGPTAEKVGRKLHTIARGQQVICVTHLPQVACCGDAHFFIQKLPNKNRVQMEVIELKDKHRVEEIARLISGEEITPSSRAHASQLLKMRESTSHPKSIRELDQSR